MKYVGMPFGMWTLFAPSFRNQLTAVFGYGTNTAKAITLSLIHISIRQGKPFTVIVS